MQSILKSLSDFLFKIFETGKRNTDSLFLDEHASQCKITNFFKAGLKEENCASLKRVDSDDVIERTPDKKRKRSGSHERDRNSSHRKRKSLKKDAGVARTPGGNRARAEPSPVLKDENINVELVPDSDSTKSSKLLIPIPVKNVYKNVLSPKKTLVDNIYVEPKSKHKTDVGSFKLAEIPDCDDVKVNNVQDSVSLSSKNLFDETSMDSLDLAKAARDAEDMCAAQLLDDIDFSSADDFGFSGNSAKPKLLNLDNYQQCEVLEVQHLGVKTYVTLKSSDGEDTARCCLKDCWAQVPLSVRDTVAVHNAFWDAESSTWVLDMNRGLLVHHPDTLLTATTVMGSLFCRRKSVLSNWFRGVEPSARVMALGSLAHELLQEVLRRKVTDLAGIHEIKAELLSSPESLKMMYASEISQSDAASELSSYVPNVALLAARCTKGSAVRGSWDENVLDVADIEEEIWVPKMGLKGKIDVTYRAKRKNETEVIPLELKTGRSSFSPEHSGQVILYLLMMNNLGVNVKRGVLVYLKDMAMKEISTCHSKARDLIVLRNEVAHSFKLDDQTADTSKVLRLPEPINNKRACERCSLRGICSAYLQVEGVKSHPLIKNGTGKHLEPQHLAYLVHWGSLLSLEESERLKNSFLSDMWKLSPSQREAKGQCLSGLALKPPVKVENGSFEHTFCRRSLKKKIFSEGEYVLVSSGSRLSITSGLVHSITDDQIVIRLKRDLSKMEGVKSFDVDKYEIISSMSYNMGGLGLLMGDTAEAEKLRRIVIDKIKPKAAVSCPDLTDLSDLLGELNPSQKAVVEQVFKEKDFLLIQGMPGTGKTTTIATVIRLLVKRGHSVLITSNTHSAVDNVLVRLVGQVDFLRIGSNSKINPKLQEYSESELYKACKTVEELESVINSKSVVGTTCLGASSPLLSRRRFSVCIVDESTQVLQTSVLRPLLMCDRFVLIGDPEQLPPVVRSETASRLGLSESLFVRLMDVGRVVSLDLQYRMNKTIEDLANAVTYGGRLKSGSPEVASLTLDVNLPPVIPNWQKLLLGSELSQSVMFVDTGYASPAAAAEGQEREGGCVNSREAALVAFLVEAFEKVGVPGNMIGVIAPFQVQVALLQNLCPSAKASTIDQFQGIDREVIIFSCTRSKKQASAENEQGAEDDLKTRETEILNDKRRLTVAITRSKRKLIILGDAATMKTYRPFRSLIGHLRENQVYKLEEGHDGFRWSDVLRKVRTT